MIHSKLIPNGQFNDASDSKITEGLEFASMEQSHSDVFLEINKSGIYKCNLLSHINFSDPLASGGRPFSRQHRFLLVLG